MNQGDGGLLLSGDMMFPAVGMVGLATLKLITERFCELCGNGLHPYAKTRRAYGLARRPAALVCRDKPARAFIARHRLGLALPPPTTSRGLFQDHLYSVPSAILSMGPTPPWRWRPFIGLVWQLRGGT